MTSPLSIQHFSDRVLKGQSSLNVRIKKPQMDSFALMLLSEPVENIQGTLIMEFFDVFWLHTEENSILGFFSSREEAIIYARSSLN